MHRDAGGLLTRGKTPLWSSKCGRVVLPNFAGWRGIEGQHLSPGGMKGISGTFTGEGGSCCAGEAAFSMNVPVVMVGVDPSRFPEGERKGERGKEGS